MSEIREKLKNAMAGQIIELNSMSTRIDVDTSKMADAILAKFELVEKARYYLLKDNICGSLTTFSVCDRKGIHCIAQFLKEVDAQNYADWLTSKEVAHG